MLITWHRQRGFTLLETLVVSAIIALIFAIVPPMLPNVMDNTYAKGAVRKLAANLKYVRSMAIAKQTEATLSLDTENKQFRINGKIEDLKLSDDTVLILVTAKSEQVSKNEGQIRFFSDGSSTGGQIKLAYRSNKFVINVDWLTGKVQISP